MPLPNNLPKRCLSIDEAAEYCNISKNTLTRHGPAPTRIGDRAVYDRRVLDRWLDRLAGLAPVEQLQADPETSLLEAIHARKNSVRHAPG
jgi:Helix-turn-helix domain